MNEFNGMNEIEQRRLLGLCFELVASVSAANLAKRGDRLPDTLVSGFAIRELSDLLEELAPGSAQKVRDVWAAQKAQAAAAHQELVRARAAEIDAERKAHQDRLDAWNTRALPDQR